MLFSTPCAQFVTVLPVYFVSRNVSIACSYVAGSLGVSRRVSKRAFSIYKPS